MSNLVVAVTLGVALFFMIASLRHPGCAVGLALSSLGIEQVLQANSAFFASRGYLWNMVTAVVLTVALGVSFASKRYRFRGGLLPVQTASLLFIGFYVWSTQWSPAGDIIQLSGFGLYFLPVMVIAPLLIQDLADARVALLVGGGISTAVCLYVAVDTSIWDVGATRLALRVVGEEKPSNPLALGDIGAFAVMVLAFRPGQTDLTRVRTWLAYIAIAVALYVMARASRGETVSALLTVLFVSWYSLQFGGNVAVPRKNSVAASFLVLGLVAAFVGVQVFETGSASRYESDALQQGYEGRAGAVSALWTVYTSDPDSWVVGLGAGYSQVLGFGYPHNQAVQALTESGIVGFAFWITAILLALRYSIQNVAKAKSDGERFASAGFLGLLLYFLALTTKRGHVLDCNLFMAIVCAERIAVCMRAAREQELASESKAEPSVGLRNSELELAKLT